MPTADFIRDQAEYDALATEYAEIMARANALRPLVHAARARMYASLDKVVDLSKVETRARAATWKPGVHAEAK